MNVVFEQQIIESVFTTAKKHACWIMVCLAGSAFPASAFDGKPQSGTSVTIGITTTCTEHNNTEEDIKDPAIQAFQTGWQAYETGRMNEAVSAFTQAADCGDMVAKWQLGHMFKDGKGVDKDDKRAFEFFTDVVISLTSGRAVREPAPFAASAFVELGRYYANGINDTAIKPNIRRAMDLYNYAAVLFDSADAQFQLAHIHLSATGLDRQPQNAARWLHHAARKGHLRAQVMLGELLIYDHDIERDPARGLMWLTIARENANAGYSDWVDEVYEQAFAHTTPEQRKTAMALHNDWQRQNIR